MKLSLLLRSSLLAPITLAAAILPSAHAGDATWLQTPLSNAWDDASNWMPNTVPNATTDKATFGTSDTTTVVIGSAIDVASMTFQPGASAYTFTVTNAKTLSMRGTPSIINNSGIEQNFICDGGGIFFYGTGTLDSTVHIDVLGNKTELASNEVTFESGSAGTSTIDVEGSDGPYPGGEAAFGFLSTAGSSTIVVHRGVNDGYGGYLLFNSATASSANITAEGGAGKFHGEGTIAFSNGGSGNSTILLEGPTVHGALGGLCTYSLFGGADTSTLLADGGTFIFDYASSGETARVVLTSRGSLDVSGIRGETAGTEIGSLEGDRTGRVLLGAKLLTIGSRNISTVYDGVILDGGHLGGTGGSLAKVGTRTLTLTGASLYTGGTTVTEGDFLVANKTGSATGTGPVQVNGGRLGGRGTIAGSLTIGSGSGSGAILIPAAGTRKEVTTTIQSALTLKADATYSCAVNSITGVSDSVVSNGVTIDPSATFVLHPKRTGTLAAGTVITPINNTAATPISGNFNGLPEGSTILAGSNTWQVSYLGGDGNDFTLTVVP
jgi:autotransporter-associated beta strand protein